MARSSTIIFRSFWNVSSFWLKDPTGNYDDENMLHIIILGEFGASGLGFWFVMGTLLI